VTNVGSTLYPLRFEPIFHYRLWGGRKLEQIQAAPLPGSGPIGEAWILSDRLDNPSLVAAGPLQGKTIGELIKADPLGMLGRYAGQYRHFPLLLKYLDAQEMLSVQVHPTDEQPELLPPGEMGKTEAWIVLQSETESKIYAGLEPGTSADELRHLNRASAEAHLAGFNPQSGDGLFIPAGTVHALGGGVVVFEVQENSDVTFRLYDWDRVDQQTGQARELHIENAIRSTDFSVGPVLPVTPIVESEANPRRERMFDCTHFKLWRVSGSAPFTVGVSDEPRAVVCAKGAGEFKTPDGAAFARTGDVYLLPAALGEVTFAPQGPAELFEIALP